MAQLTKAGNHFRQSDVTLWGLVALGCGAFAIVAANVSGFVPPSVFTALHASRLGGGGFEQMRTEVAELRREAAQLRRDNAAIQQRFSLAEQKSGEAARRLGALEVSIPTLLEAIPATADVDRSAVTASIPEGEWITMPAEGGSVRIRRQLLPALAASSAAPQVEADGPDESAMPMPAPLGVPATRTEDAPLELLPLGSAAPEGDAPGGNAASDAIVTAALPADPLAEPAPGPLLPAPRPLAIPGEVGVALEIPPGRSNAIDAWQDYQNKVGPLLLGLKANFGTDSKGSPRIVAGPLPSRSEADALCARLAQVGIACEAVPYGGVPLPG